MSKLTAEIYVKDMYERMNRDPYAVSENIVRKYSQGIYTKDETFTMMNALTPYFKIRK